MNRRKVSSRSQNTTTKPKRRNIKESAIPIKSVYVDVSNSNISTFRFLNRLHKVLSLNATNTLISDFSGAPMCSTIRQIKMQGSPIAKNPHYRLMILISINPDIEFIDNIKVTKDEKDKSLLFQPLAQPKLFDGFILTSLDPITLSRANETVTINSDDLKEAKSVNRNEIKFNQTIDMMEQLSFDISNTSDELGVGHIPKLPIRELLKQKSFNAADFLPTNSKVSFQRSQKESQSPFVSAFKEHTQTQEELVESSILYDSPEKREERHSLIMQDSPSRYSSIRNSNNDSMDLDRRYPLSGQINTQNGPQEEEEEINEQMTIEQLYDDVIEPNITNKKDITVEQIFDMASEIIGSPEKPSRYFEDSTSISSDMSTSLLQKNSRIPVKMDSPSKKYGEGLDASRLTQTKFGGYRKISDTESIISDADNFDDFIEFEEEEEEEPSKDMQSQEENLDLKEPETNQKADPNWVASGDLDIIDSNITEPSTSEQNFTSNENIGNQETNEEEQEEAPSKDMPDPDWVISNEEEENNETNEKEIPASNKNIENQEEEATEEKDLLEQNGEAPSKDMPDPDWVVSIEEEEETNEAKIEDEKVDSNEMVVNQEEEEATEEKDLLEQNEEAPSKDMPDLDWVVSNEEEANGQEIPASNENIENQEEEATIDKNLFEQEQAPSKDMPDPGWVVSGEGAASETPISNENADNQVENEKQETKETLDPNWVASGDLENIESTERTDEPTASEQDFQISFESPENKDENPETNEQEQITSNENAGEVPLQDSLEPAEEIVNAEEPAAPSKDMPDPDWVVSEETGNIQTKSTNEELQEPTGIEQENPNYTETREDESAPSKDMPDPSWAVSEDTIQNNATNEQPQEPTQTEQENPEEPATNEQDLLGSSTNETGNEEINPEEATAPSKDMPDPSWAVSEDTIQNNTTNEQPQEPTQTEQENPISTENQEEPAAPSKDMPDPDWVIQEDAAVSPTERSIQIENNNEQSSTTEFDNYDPNVIAILDQQIKPREFVQLDESQPTESDQKTENQNEQTPQIEGAQESSSIEFSPSFQEEINHRDIHSELSQETAQNEEPLLDPSWVIPDEEEQKKEEAHPFEFSPQDAVQNDTLQNNEQNEPEGPSLDPDWVIKTGYDDDE